MARTALAYTALLPNGGISDPAGTAVNTGAGNGHVIARALPERTLLRVTNTHTAAHTVTIKAGAYPPAFAAGQGDLSVTVPASGAAFIGPLESGRFLQNDGSLIVEVPDAAHTGNITALRIPGAV
ncbi:hypothetical protein [Actinomadura rudentiformis]|uniref:Uncharacterized protein n=1 Tax=Actinomadura rudentiformis TaxID=359158 RepID=A0A6H9YN81_9ACTN|nr:hypothetical protein [Actinomadura rudentiformis]KAB2344875.1 hypothetical protein F8566_30250 [Actinomadura rudentiformis]